MKTLQTLLLALFLIFCFVLSTKAESLKETSKNFTALISQVDLTDAEFTAKLKPFIDPEANVDSICSNYYQHWKQCISDNSYAVKTTIEEVEKINKQSAVVYIANVWKTNSGNQYYLVSSTDWVKKQNKWYRSTKESTIVQNEKLDMAYNE